MGFNEGFNEGLSYAERQTVVNGGKKSKTENTVGTIHATGDQLPVSNNELYTIKELPGKGLGCFAMTMIPKGTRIILEEPLFTVPSMATDLQSMEMVFLKQLKSLSKMQQHMFFSLHNAHKDKCSPVIGTIKTNAMPFGARGSEGAIFPSAARINHSCKPNSQNTWNRNLERLTIHSFKDIEEGEELTIAYVDGTELYDERQAYFEEAFGFRCQCEVCAVPREESRKRDRRLEEMARLDHVLGDGRRMMSKPEDCIQDAYTLFRILIDEGIAGSRIARVYNDALQISIAHSDQARAKVFAQRAYEGRVLLEGEDSPETMRLKAIADNPAGHGLFGSTKKWEQSVEAIPGDLNKPDFEDWLWKQKSWKA
ncbi:SET domain-containing protein [Histoplasma capsulatum]|uniref:SET domain-containing protein n=2 Tax=Histoplasma TaxID=5036 RepID=A0A8A1MHJ7_AJECA|nr:SET domain-containing protein [Histoplasma capsulatum]